MQSLSYLETCTLKSWAFYSDIKLSYLACAHPCQERSHSSLTDKSFPSHKLNDGPGEQRGCMCATSGWRRSSLAGLSWSHSAWQIALNPSSWGWAQSGVLNWHLQQAWRLAPVSRSICCTAIRLHLCTRQTCVSWITFKLIWGLCWSDSRPSGAWRKPQLTPQGNPVIHPYHTSFCTLHVSGLFINSNEGIMRHYIRASSRTLIRATDFPLRPPRPTRWGGIYKYVTSVWSALHFTEAWRGDHLRPFY